jgi:pimeloyl-ACP methyl ester carboxylesterase
MTPFRVQWGEADVRQLLERIEACPLPETPATADWSLGCDRTFLARIQNHWVTAYDWQAAAESLNRHPQYTAVVGDLPIHFVHVAGEARGRKPLLISHGWPGSHHEFWKVIEPLAYPSRHGSRPEDAFDLVIPSLPGYGFSGKPHGPMGQRETAELWNSLMTDHLGYRRYAAQGGDFGAIVTSWLGLDHGDNLAGIHLNMLAFRSLAEPANREETEWLEASQAAQQQLGAYSHLHMTRPHSLVWATAGNPLGQAAWMLERFHDWTDMNGRDLEEVFGLDDLITNAMIYLMTDSFSSSLGFYRGVVEDGLGILPEGQRCETPTAYAAFPGDALMPAAPLSRVELAYNLTRYTPMPRGGHFAAMQEPDLFVQDLREWGRELNW